MRDHCRVSADMHRVARSLDSRCEARQASVDGRTTGLVAAMAEAAPREAFTEYASKQVCRPLTSTKLQPLRRNQVHSELHDAPTGSYLEAVAQRIT